MILTISQIEEFLREVDSMFPIPISQKVDLHEYACKLYNRADIRTVLENNKIVAMAAGYTENVIENRGYISIAAVLPEARGRGYGKKLIGEIMNIAENKGLDAVHLYAKSSNKPGVRMLHSLGFTEWHIPDEPRPDDLHLIYYFERQK